MSASPKLQEHLQRLAASRRGTTITQDHKAKISCANKGKTGFFWKGKKMTPEARAKMSLAKKGTSVWSKGAQFSETHKLNISKSHADVSGPNNPNWKGGVTYGYRLFRKSAAYKLWRKTILARDSYTCVLCGAQNDLHVDHIHSFAKYPHLRLDINNGRVLCAPCHRATPTYGKRLSCA